MVSEMEIDKAAARIVDFYHPDQPVLFGSHAHGMPHKGNDLDLLIVKETNENPVNRTAGLQKALKDMFLPMDILVYTPTEIAKDEPTPKSLINWILNGVEGCKHLIIRTLRVRSVSGFPLNCLFGADSKIRNRNLHLFISIDSRYLVFIP